MLLICIGQRAARGSLRCMIWIKIEPGKWLPESGHEVADAPDFERYGPEFDPTTGNGGLEVWVPLKG